MLSDILGYGTLSSWIIAVEGIDVAKNKKGTEAEQRGLLQNARDRDGVGMLWWRKCSDVRWLQMECGNREGIGGGSLEYDDH